MAKAKPMPSASAEPALPALPMGVEAEPVTVTEPAEVVEAAEVPVTELAEVLSHSYDAESGILTVVLISGPKLRFAPGEIPAGLSDLTIPF